MLVGQQPVGGGGGTALVPQAPQQAAVLCTPAPIPCGNPKTADTSVGPRYKTQDVSTEGNSAGSPAFHKVSLRIKKFSLLLCVVTVFRV